MTKLSKKNTKRIDIPNRLDSEFEMGKIFPDRVMSLPELYRAVIGMTQLLKKETQAFKEMNLTLVRSLQGQKEMLTDVLEKFNGWLGKHPQLLEEFPKAERLALRQLLARFREEMEANHQELNKHHLVQQRVLKMIQRAVVENDPLKATYKRNGLARVDGQQGGKGGWFSHLAVSLDESI